MKSQHGFTLLEVLITVTIVAILAATASMGYMSYVERAQRSEAKSVMMDLSQRLERYYTDEGSYDGFDVPNGMGRIPSEAERSQTYDIDVDTDDQTFTITAKLPKYQSGNIVNEACVETPTVPGGNPDDCDEATVTTNPNKIKVCELETKKLIWINETEFDEALHSKDYDDCKEEKPPVELPHTGPLDTFLNVVGIGSLAGAGIAYYASRRSLG